MKTHTHQIHTGCKSHDNLLLLLLLDHHEGAHIIHALDHPGRIELNENTHTHTQMRPDLCGQTAAEKIMG